MLLNNLMDSWRGKKLIETLDFKIMTTFLFSMLERYYTVILLNLIIFILSDIQ